MGHKAVDYLKEIRIPSPGNLHRLRRWAGLTQDEASLLIGVKLPTFKAWEYGVYEVPNLKYQLFTKRALLLVKLRQMLPKVYLDTKVIIKIEKEKHEETFW